MLELMDILWTVFIQREIKLVTNNRIQLKCNTCLIAGLIAGLRLDSKLCVESTGLGPEPTSCGEPVRCIWNLALPVHLSYSRLLNTSLQWCVVYFISMASVLFPCLDKLIFMNYKLNVSLILKYQFIFGLDIIFTIKINFK